MCVCVVCVVCAMRVCCTLLSDCVDGSEYVCHCVSCCVLYHRISISYFIAFPTQGKKQPKKVGVESMGGVN